MGRKRLLIADDEMIIRQLLKTILEESPFEVVGEAVNGVEAVAQCKRLKPDIVCLDISMPKMSGMDALTEIRSSCPDMMAVMISASATADNVHDAIQKGAVGFLVKPFKMDQVVDRLVQITTAKTT